MWEIDQRSDSRDSEENINAIRLGLIRFRTESGIQYCNCENIPRSESVSTCIIFLRFASHSRVQIVFTVFVPFGIALSLGLQAHFGVVTYRKSDFRVKVTISMELSIISRILHFCRKVDFRWESCILFILVHSEPRGCPGVESGTCRSWASLNRRHTARARNGVAPMKLLLHARVGIWQCTG